MFPMMLPLLGAAAGALLKKDDPLKGALMGGALGFGGAALPGLLGAGGATAGIVPGATAATSGTQAGLLAAQEAGLGASSLGWGGATTGIQGGLNAALGSEAGAGVGGLLGNADKIAKPVGTAMDVAKTMAGNEPQIQAPPPPPLPNNQPFNAAGAIQTGQMMRQYEEQEAMRRRALMDKYAAQIGGGYGRVA